MWRDVWKGFDESDIPIGHVTNGAHVLSYIAPRMKALLDTYLGMDWDRHISDPERWERIQDIPDTVLWRTRYELRQKMIDFLREDLSRNWMKYGYSKTWQEELFAKINPAALMIGFARRFAPYKRADLILSDLDRLDRILNHPTRPVHIVFAGKSHPNDEMGKDLIKKVISVCKDERFRGKIFFVEGYDIRIARHLVQGVDVWLNNPRRPLEASGTSGEKVVANGVLNLSISDGWWVEGYRRNERLDDRPRRQGIRRRDGQRRRGGRSIPLCAPGKQRDPSVLRSRDVRPPREVDRHDQAVDADPRPPFQHGEDAHRILPRPLPPDGAAGARTLRRFLPDGPGTGRLEAEAPHALLLAAPPGRQHRGDPRRHDPRRAAAGPSPSGSIPENWTPEEVLVELVIGKKDGAGFADPPECVPLKITARAADGVLTFSGLLHGPAERRLRLRHPRPPHHPHLAAKQETGLVYWG